RGDGGQLFAAAMGNRGGLHARLPDAADVEETGARLRRRVRRRSIVGKFGFPVTAGAEDAENLNAILEDRKSDSQTPLKSHNTQPSSDIVMPIPTLRCKFKPCAECKDAGDERVGNPSRTCLHEPTLDVDQVE